MTTNQTIDGVPRELDQQTAAGIWRDGEPPHPWKSEYFLAQMKEGQLVVLRKLPEEYSYDYTTADGTYVMRTSILRWAQLSTSEYVQPEQPASQPQGEPVAFTAVGVLRDDGDGGLAPDWILEGGTAELWAGAVLLIADEDQDLCAEDGHCELYRLYVEQPAPVSDLLDQIERLKTENMQLIQASTSRLMGEIAPVAVVMPVRMAMTGRGLMDAPTVNHHLGWNACLDEVTRLNSKSQ